MKSLNTNKTITVNPAARRCGSDDQIATSSDSDKLDDIVAKMRTTTEFLAVSDRVLGFANLADKEISLLTSAAQNADFVALEKSAQNVANLATEFGASDLLRSCYQLLISVRQGNQKQALELINTVSADYAALKTSLKLA